MQKNLLLAVSFFLFIACVDTAKHSSSGNKETAVVVADSLVEEHSEARMVKGFVGTGTSMNTIELVSVGATDTLWLELDDETVRDATLEVGAEIVAWIIDEADGSQRVLITKDAEEE